MSKVNFINFIFQVLSKLKSIFSSFIYFSNLPIQFNFNLNLHLNFKLNFLNHFYSCPYLELDEPIGLCSLNKKKKVVQQIWCVLAIFVCDSCVKFFDRNCNQYVKMSFTFRLFNFILWHFMAHKSKETIKTPTSSSSSACPANWQPCIRITHSPCWARNKNTNCSLYAHTGENGRKGSEKQTKKVRER